MHRIIYRPDSTWFFLVDVVKLALGIFIGGMMLFFGYEALIAHRLEMAANAANAARNQLVAPPVQPSRAPEVAPPAIQGTSDRNSRSR